MNLLTRQLLVCLGTAHVLGDFVLRPGREAQDARKLWVVLQRALTVAALSYLFCGAWGSWLIPTGVFLGHTVVDAATVRLRRRDAASFLLEQSAYAAVLIVIAVAAALRGASSYWVSLFGAVYLKVLIVVMGAVFSVLAGGVLIGRAVQPLLDEMNRGADGNEAASQGDRGLEHGGRLIGRLERALILLFVLSGQPASVGFLVAAKSIFRFGELKERHQRMEAEYIIIGTMMSFGFGLLIAYVTEFLLGLAWT